MTMEFNRLWTRFLPWLLLLLKKSNEIQGHVFIGGVCSISQLLFRCLYISGVSTSIVFINCTCSERLLTHFWLILRSHEWSRDYSRLFAHTSEQSWTSFGNINIQLNIVLRILRAFLISFSKCSKNHLLWNSTNS